MIRTATFDDLDALVGLSRRYHDEEQHGWLPFDETYVAERFRAQTIDTVLGITLALECDGALAGYLAAAETKFFSAPVKVGVELAWYIVPERRGRFFRPLIAEFEAWCRERGCAASVLAMVDFRDPGKCRALEALYCRAGYGSYERAFLKRLT